MRILKPFNYFELSEAKIDGTFKVSIVDDSGFGMATYFDITDLIKLNDTLIKLLKKHNANEMPQMRK